MSYSYYDQDSYYHGYYHYNSNYRYGPYYHKPRGYHKNQKRFNKKRKSYDDDKSELYSCGIRETHSLVTVGQDRIIYAIIFGNSHHVLKVSLTKPCKPEILANHRGAKLRGTDLYISCYNTSNMNIILNGQNFRFNSHDVCVQDMHVCRKSPWIPKYHFLKYKRQLKKKELRELNHYRNLDALKKRILAMNKNSKYHRKTKLTLNIHRVCVVGIPHNWDEKDLHKLLQPYGACEVREKPHGGVGYAIFESPYDVINACINLGSKYDIELTEKLQKIMPNINKITDVTNNKHTSSKDHDIIPKTNKKTITQIKNEEKLSIKNDKEEQKEQINTLSTSQLQMDSSGHLNLNDSMTNLPPLPTLPSTIESDFTFVPPPPPPPQPQPPLTKSPLPDFTIALEYTPPPSIQQPLSVPPPPPSNMSLPPVARTPPRFPQTRYVYHQPPQIISPHRVPQPEYYPAPGSQPTQYVVQVTYPQVQPVHVPQNMYYTYNPPQSYY